MATHCQTRFSCFKSITIQKALADIDDALCALEKKQQANDKAIEAITKIKEAIDEK